MIVIIDRPGQLCNRLWAYTPFIALCLKHNINLYVAHFDDYSKHFENVDTHKSIKIGFINHYVAYRLLINLLKVLRINYLSKKSKITVHANKISSVEKLKKLLLRKNSINFINSWHQPYSIQDIKDHKKEIKDIFTPKITIRKDVDDHFDNIQNESEVKIGVHMRRGDYKTFLDGRFYYSDEIYKRYMNQMSTQLNKKNKKPLFVLTSNRQINKKSFKDFNTTVIEEATTMHDLYALSKCSYIFGPPSTFSMWASFYNNVPLKFIMSEHEEISLSDFSPIIAQDIFQNGNTLVF